MNTKPRQPGGIPAGGEFAERSLAESPTVVLAANAEKPEKAFVGETEVPAESLRAALAVQEAVKDLPEWRIHDAAAAWAKGAGFESNTESDWRNFDNSHGCGSVIVDSDGEVSIAVAGAARNSSVDLLDGHVGSVDAPDDDSDYFGTYTFIYPTSTDDHADTVPVAAGVEVDPRRGTLPEPTPVADTAERDETIAMFKDQQSSWDQRQADIDNLQNELTRERTRAAAVTAAVVLVEAFPDAESLTISVEHTWGHSFRNIKDSRGEEIRQPHGFAWDPEYTTEQKAAPKDCMVDLKDLTESELCAIGATTSGNGLYSLNLPDVMAGARERLPEQ